MLGSIISYGKWMHDSFDKVFNVNNGWIYTPFQPLGLLLNINCVYFIDFLLHIQGLELFLKIASEEEINAFIFSFLLSLVTFYSSSYQLASEFKTEYWFVSPTLFLLWIVCWLIVFMMYIYFRDTTKFSKLFLPIKCYNMFYLFGKICNHLFNICLVLCVV